MASLPKRVYWDACAWIALIQKEKIPVAGSSAIEDREQMCRTVIEAAKQGKLEIVASTLCLVEVCKESSNNTADKLADYFETDYLLMVALDRFVAEEARKLMQGGLGLKPPDASHIATALISSVEEMHTFDGRILALNGVLSRPDGTKMKICKPALLGTNTAPLFGGAI
jgi:predicted nucleic acid-binding protein